MKERGKSAKSDHDKANFFSDSNYFSSSSDLPCKMHPSNSSSVGICAYCLNEKLINLICSDCGEQRFSSCSCSDLSSYRNSSCIRDVGSVGRISFLIENEKGSNGYVPKTLFSQMKTKNSETEDCFLLKRSNSCIVEVKKRKGFWRIGKLFKKKVEKDGFSERNRGGFDRKSEASVMDVSRSRSLRSFRDDSFDLEVGSFGCSTAKVSDFNESEPSKSQFKGRLIDNESGFPLKETDFNRMDDDDEFIDLKIDLSGKSKTEYSVFKKCDPLELVVGGDSMGSSSCRITVNERGFKKVKNSHMKAWKWIFKHHSRKKELNHILDS